MVLNINWESPVIPERDVLAVQPSDLDDFYVSASAYDRSNLFFVLLTSFHHYLEAGAREKAAHLSFLMAYYLFLPLTPPGAYELALHYIRQAVSLDPLDQYKEWLTLMERGN